MIFKCSSGTFSELLFKGIVTLFSIILLSSLRRSAEIFISTINIARKINTVIMPVSIRFIPEEIKTLIKFFFNISSDELSDLSLIINENIIQYNTLFNTYCKLFTFINKTNNKK